MILLLANVAVAQLTFQIEMNPDPPQRGETIHVALTVGNRGGGSLFGVTVQARVPQNVFSFSPTFTTGGGQCPPSFCDPLELVTWTLGTLPAGASRTVTMPLVVGTSVAAGTEIAVDASAQANGVSPINRDASVVVEVAPVLELALDEEQNPVAPRAQLTYTLTFGNRSDVTVTNIALRIPLPAGLTFLSATDGGVLSGNTVRWALGALPPGAHGHRQVTVRVGAGIVPGSQISIDAAEIRGRAAGEIVAAYAVAVTRVETAPPLALAVELNPDPVRRGETLLAALTVSNRSGAALAGVQVQARVPQNVFSFSPTFTTGGGQCPPSFCDANELVTWTLGTVPAGASRTVTMPLVAGTSSVLRDGTVLTVWAEVRNAGIESTTASASVGVHNDPVLELAVDDSSDPVAPGNQLTYTLTFGNRSGVTIPAGQLSLPLPTGVTFVSATGGGVRTDDVVEWNLGALEVGEGGKRQVVVRVNPGVTPGHLLLVNAAQLSGRTATAGGAAYAVAVTRVENAPPLALAVELNPDPVRRGETLLAALTVSNRSGAALAGVQVQARVPQNVFSFSPTFTTGGGQCPPSFCDPNELVTWTLGTIPARASRTVTMPLVVGTGSVLRDGTVLTVWVEVRNAGIKGTTASASVVVHNDPVLELTVDDSRDPIAPGNLYTYQLTFGNRSVEDVTSTRLRMPLPAGTTFVSASVGGVLNGRVVVWNLGRLRAGQSGSRQVVVKAANGNIRVPTGTLLQVNAAEMTGNTAAGNTSARAVAVTRVEPSRPLRLNMVLSPNPVARGQAMIVTMTVRNMGTAPLSGVQVQARVPQNVFSFSPSLTTGGGQCPPSFCDPNELVTWTLGTIPARASRRVTMPPVVGRSGIPDGTLIAVEAEVKNATVLQAARRATARVSGP